MPLITALWFILICFPFMQACADRPVPEDEKHIVNIIYENDIFADKDNGYTDGIRAAWLSPEATTPKWARSFVDLLPISIAGKKRISLAIGQNMYTPRDLSQKALIVNDQPYGGFLYGTFGIISDTKKTLDILAITAGVVGPYSYAEQTQKAVHHIVGSPHPEGWNNQLHNEVGGDIAFQRKWRNMVQFSPFGLGLDATPDVGVTVGTINTNAALGTTFRLGYDLPSDYGPPRIRPSLPGSDFFVPTHNLGGYIFSSIEGRAVARNIFLDGNSFEDSPHVEKNPFIASLQLGVAMTYHAMRLSYTHVLMSKEFDTQKSAPRFGAVTFSYRF